MAQRRQDSARCSGNSEDEGQTLRAAGALGREIHPAAWGEIGASALSRHDAQPRPLGSSAGGGEPGDGWLAGHQACLPPRGRCLSLEGMGRWFSSLAWLLLCFLSFWELNISFLFLFLILLFNQIVIRVKYVHLRALIQCSKV